MDQITEDLCTALKNGDVNAVKNWLDNGGDLEAQFRGCTALLLCTGADVRGHIHADVIRLLLDQGANVNVEDGRGRSPLHWVVSDCDESPSDLEVVKWLLDRGSNMNLQDKDGKTPLYLAIENRRNVTARLLMDRGADVNVRNKIGSSALHCVVGKHDKSPNNLEIIQFLVDGGADLDVQDNNGNTPLYLALWNRSNVTARLLLDSGANVNVQNKVGWAPLHCVVGNDDTSPSNLEVITWLVDGGADTNMQSEIGKTPLYLAVQNKKINIVRLLLDRGVDVNVRDKMGWSPLHYVMDNYDNFPNNVKVIKWLLDAGADINVQNNNGKTPLDLAMDKEVSAPELGSLLGSGTNFNQSTFNQLKKYDRFPLHYVVSNSNWYDFNIPVMVAKCMIDRGIDVNRQDNDGNTPLHLALLNKNNAIVTLLLDREAKVNVRNNSGWSPLHCVLNHCDKSPCYVEIVKSLIDRGVDVNMPDKYGNTPLHLALMKKNSAIVRLLLDSGTNVDIQNNSGWSPLHYVMNHCFEFSSDVEVVKSLIDEGADINVKDNDGNTPLHLLCEKLRIGIRRNCSSSHLQSNNLHIISDRISNIVTLLLDGGANVNIRNNSGRSPLHYVVNHHFELSSHEESLYPYESVLRANEFSSCLEVIKSLIDRGVDVNMQDIDGKTPLYLALVKKNRVTARLLLDRGANVNIQDNSGWSPLHYVLNHCFAFSSHLEVIKSLIDKGADVNMQDNDRNTPLHLFLNNTRTPVTMFECNPLGPSSNLHVSNRFSNVVTLLMDSGANVDVQNGDGMLPLHYAVSRHYARQYTHNVTKSITSQTMNVNVQNNKGQTPVHLCVRNLNVEGLSTLLDWGGSMLIEDEDGNTPLQYLTQEGNTELNNCLKQYMQRVKCAGLVNDVELLNVHIDDNTGNSADYQSDLLNELEMMKREKVGWSTVRHVFSRYYDPLYVDNGDLQAAIDENKYSRYGELLKSTFAKAKKRRVILDRAVSCFNIPIPVETIRIILCYLDYSDILSLITSYEPAQVEGN